MMTNAISKKTLTIVFVTTLTAVAAIVYSHCQIPCGIYGDQARFDMIAENITTIEKSMKQIAALSAEDKHDYNQIVRWVQNKEKHADDTTHIITYYFLSQRLIPVADDNTKAYEAYVKKLTILHEMMYNCMKAKQTIDLVHIEKLKSLLAEFNTAYFAASK